MKPPTNGFLWRRILELQARIGTVASGSGGSGITQLTGDVTAGPGSGSQVATIPNDTVSNAQLSEMDEYRIKGRSAGSGTGNPEDLDPDQISEILDAAGDPFIRSSAASAGSPIVSGFGGLQFVDKILVTSAQTSVTFSGLDGDADEVYLIQGRIIVPSGGTPWFTWQPNSITTNQTSVRFYANNGSSATDGRNDLGILQGVGGSTVSFYFTIWAKKNPNGQSAPRNYRGDWRARYGSNTEAVGTMSGEWNETSTNITSIDIVSDTASKIGNGSEFTLYRYAQQ